MLGIEHRIPCTLWKCATTGLPPEPRKNISFPEKIEHHASGKCCVWLRLPFSENEFSTSGGAVEGTVSRQLWSSETFIAPNTS